MKPFIPVVKNKQSHDDIYEKALKKLQNGGPNKKKIYELFLKDLKTQAGYSLPLNVLAPYLKQYQQLGQSTINNKKLLVEELNRQTDDSEYVVQLLKIIEQPENPQKYIAGKMDFEQSAILESKEESKQDQTEKMNSQSGKSLNKQNYAANSEHYSQAVSVANDLISDRTLWSKIPEIPEILKLMKKGKISQKDGKKQITELIKDAQQSNPTVQALINELIIQYTKPKSSQSQKLRGTQPGGFQLDPNMDEELKINVSQISFDSKTGKALSQFQNQAKPVVNKSIDDVNGLQSDIPQPQIQAPKIGSDTKEIKPDVSVINIIKKAEQIKNNSQNSQQVREKAASIISSIKQSQQSAKQAEISNQIEETKVENQDQNLQYSSNTPSDLNAFPRGSNASKSITDVQQSEIFKQMVDGMIEHYNLNFDQKSAAEAILYDPEKSIDNLELGRNRKAKSVKIPAKYVKTLAKEMQMDNGNYGQLMNYQIVDKNGKQYSLADILSLIPAVCENISKIQGQVSLDEQRLKDQKSQESVFTTKIKKNETNNFKINQGSAFRLRACC